MLVLRSVKGSPLTVQELDNNFIEIANRIDLSTEQTITGLKTFNTTPIIVGNLTPGSNQLSTYNYMKSLKYRYVFSSEYPIDLFSNPDAIDRYFLLNNKKVVRILKFENNSWLTFINPDKIISMSNASFILKNNKLYGIGSDIDGIGYLLGNTELSKFTLLSDNVADIYGHKQGYFIVIKKIDGTYWALGENDGMNYNEGGFGIDNFNNYNTFVQLPLVDPIQVFVGCSGIFYTSGVNKQVYAAGANLNHELGPIPQYSSTFQLIPGMDNIVNIITEDSFVIFEKSDGTYYGTGAGITNYMNVDVESAVNGVLLLLSFPGLSKPKYISCNKSVMIVVDSENNVWWSGDPGNNLIQISVEFNNPKSIDQNKWGTFLTKQDSSVYVYGETSGELFTNSDDEWFTEFTLNPYIFNPNKISGGSWHTIIEKSDGTLWAAGELHYYITNPIIIS